jgi:hypothetical protein
MFDDLKFLMLKLIPLGSEKRNIKNVWKCMDLETIGYGTSQVHNTCTIIQYNNTVTLTIKWVKTYNTH